MSNVIAYPGLRRCADSRPDRLRAAVRSSLSQSVLDLKSALDNLRGLPLARDLSDWRDRVAGDIALLMEDTSAFVDASPADAHPIEEILDRLNHLRGEVGRLLSAHRR